jgi:hypothetical protein
MARVARNGTADSQAMMPAMIAGPSVGFFGVACIFCARAREGFPIPAVDGYQGPTEIPAGADGERDLEAEAAAAAKIAAQDAKAAPLALVTPPQWRGIPIPPIDGSPPTGFPCR